MNGKLLNTVKIGDYVLADYTRSSIAVKLGIDNDLPREYFDNCNLTLLVLTFINKMSGHHHFITSGYRCPLLNEKVGGVNNSLHQRALAIDFELHYTERDAVFLKAFKKYALAFVQTFLPHLKLRVDIHFVEDTTKKTAHLEIQVIS